LDKVITGDESTMFYYDPETKWQSKEWHMKRSPHPKKTHMSRSRVKTVIFFTDMALCKKNLYLQYKDSYHAFYKDVLE
jgi:hypothetical protein